MSVNYGDVPHYARHRPFPVPDQINTFLAAMRLDWSIVQLNGVVMPCGCDLVWVKDVNGTQYIMDCYLHGTPFGVWWAANSDEETVELELEVGHDNVN